jgi:hypothetical protein
MPRFSHKPLIYDFLQQHIPELMKHEKGYIETLYRLCFPGEYVVSTKTFRDHAMRFIKEFGIERQYKENKYYKPSTPSGKWNYRNVVEPEPERPASN